MFGRAINFSFSQRSKLALSKMMLLPPPIPTEDQDEVSDITPSWPRVGPVSGETSRQSIPGICETPLSDTHGSGHNLRETC